MSLHDDFKEASLKIQQIETRPTDSELLELYALFKQSTLGDAQGKRPSMLQIKAQKKFDAWKRLEGMKKDEAQTKYIACVKKIIKNQKS